MKNFLKACFLGAILMAAAACTTVDSVGPNTKIAAGVEAVQASRSVVEGLVTAGKITKVDALNLYNQQQSLIALFETLRTLPPSDATTSKINAALAALTALQGYLELKKGSS